MKQAINLAEQFAAVLKGEQKKVLSDLSEIRAELDADIAGVRSSFEAVIRETEAARDSIVAGLEDLRSRLTLLETHVLDGRVSVMGLSAVEASLAPVKASTSSNAA